MDTIFDTPFEAAYEALELKVAPRRWCAFDVAWPEAKAGNASRFGMTLWDDGPRRDVHTQRIWYKVPRRGKTGEKQDNRTNLCNALRIAVEHQLPITGMLRDRANQQHCSIKHLFTIAHTIESHAEDAFWLWLMPHNPDDLGCVPTLQEVEKSDWQIDQLAGLNRHLSAQAGVSAIDRDARLKRLAGAPKIPKQIVVTTTAFVRNPDVVAEVLHLAKGKCGYCQKDAPFRRRKGGTPYLEVHHRVPLADGGEDTIENAIAACPNCHREQHHGSPT